MATRWAYEALSVEQFRSNKYESPFFKYDMVISQNDWYASFLLPTLKVKVNECLAVGKDPDYKEYTEINFNKINYHINDIAKISGFEPGNWKEKINSEEFNDFIADETKLYLDSLRTLFRMKSRSISVKRDSLYKQLSGKMGEDEFLKMKSENYNENVANYVLNRLTTSKIYDSPDKLIQKADPVFMPPSSRTGRAHFFAPFKQLGSLKIGTLLFNVLVIWIMILILFFTLYFNLLKRFIGSLESMNLPILRKFGRDFLQF
jgi:hypothetical protein